MLFHPLVYVESLADFHIKSYADRNHIGSASGPRADAVSCHNYSPFL